MSKIKIEPNVSGSGTLTIAAPNTNTDRTITLPDKTGTLVDTSENPFLAYDSWFLDADQTANATVTGWTRRTTGYLNIGSAMSVSSGDWTFPTTGIWKIELVPLYNFGANTSDQAVITIVTTTDNFSGTTSVQNALAGPTWVTGHCPVHYVFDVEDTSTHKVRYVTSSLSGGSKIAGGSATITYVSYMKIGET